MNINELDLTAQADDAKRVTILHPVNGTETDMVFLVVGSEATQVRRAARRARQELFDRAARAHAAGGDVTPLADDELDELDARAVASAVAGWEGVQEDGQPVPYSQSKAIELMTRFPWLARQIERAHRSDELFFGTAPSASSRGQSTSSDSASEAKTA